jgi:geranylgeranyl transferase type-2 subunit beta
MVDVFHTFFALAGLSFLKYPDLAEIDPVYALPVSTLKRMGFDLPWIGK